MSKKIQTIQREGKPCETKGCSGIYKFRSLMDYLEYQYVSCSKCDKEKPAFKEVTHE